MDRIAVKANVLMENQQAAAQNRRLFEQEGTLVINLMSAPGAGKTSLLEATLRNMLDQHRAAVIEGDLQTDLDAERIRALGVRSHQITTGTVCHLDAGMIARALAEFPVEGLELLIIENVGNLILSSFLLPRRTLPSCDCERHRRGREAEEVYGDVQQS